MSTPTRLLFLATVLVFAACAKEERPPNLVLVLADDLGWADVGFQGSTFHRTPALDALAERGRVFRVAYAAAPVCSPSRAALLTGLHPARLQLTRAVDGPASGPPGPVSTGPADARVWEPIARDRLPADTPTVAQALRAAGYRTALIGKLHLGNDPHALGFDLARGYATGGVPRGYFPPYALEELEDGPADEYLTDRLTEEAVAFVESSGDEPFFLFLSHYAPHSPFEAPAATVANYEDRVDPAAGQRNPVYGAMIEHLDRGIGRLLDALERTGVADDTLLLFTSDNGGWEERRASGNRPAYRVTSNAPLRSGKGRLYEGGVRVPLVVAGAGVRSGTSEVPVTGLDLAATLLAFAGEEPARTADGRDLRRLLAGDEAAFERESLTFHFPHQSMVSSLRRGRHKLLHFWIRDRDELYDLEADPGRGDRPGGPRPRTHGRAARRADAGAGRARRASSRAACRISCGPVPDRAASPAHRRCGSRSGPTCWRAWTRLRPRAPARGNRHRRLSLPWARSS